MRDTTPAEATANGGHESTQQRSRGFGPGSSRVVIAAALALVAFAATVIVIATTSSGATGAGAAVHRTADRSRRGGSAKYGGFPSWLPRPKVPVGRLVTASAAHPWLAIEGDTVRVVLPPARVFATTVGPSVPEEGGFPVPRTTPCSFLVTFARSSGAIPLHSSAFTIVDEQSQIHHPHVTLLNGRGIPSHIAAGQTVTLRVSDVLPTGSGTLSWSPDGGRPVVSWDFDVEID